jgi:hypothetical protein
MTITAALTAARARLAAHKPNPIGSDKENYKWLKRDALAIFDELIAQAEAATQCPYLETVGGETWCNYPGEKEPDYVEMEGRCQS